MSIKLNSASGSITISPEDGSGNAAVTFPRAGFASIASPTFTGTPAAPTASTGTNTTQIATTAFVQTEVTALVDSAPSTLNTLNELAAALGDDANFSTTVTNSIATKLPLAGGTMTGAIAMGTAKITGLGDPTAAQDAATKNYSDTTFLALSGGTLTGGLIGTDVTVNGTLDIEEVKEKVSVSATDIVSGSNVVAVDLLDGAIDYYTANASGNWTLNFRGDGSTTLNSIMSVGQSMTYALLVTNGSTPRYGSAYQIDGSSVTPKWSGGTAPTAGNASSIDSYSFTIIKTADATFTVLASQTQYA